MNPNVSLVRTLFIGKLKNVRLILLMLAIVLLATTTILAQPLFLKRITSGSKNFTTWNGRLYYSLADSLFTSDGTSAGTSLVKKVGETILRISKTGLGDDAFFITRTGDKES